MSQRMHLTRSPKNCWQRPEVSKVHSTLENAAPVVKLNIDAMKANAENITPLQIAGTVSACWAARKQQP